MGRDRTVFDAWLQGIPNTSTRKTYAAAIRAYFRVVFGNSKDMNRLCKQYFEEERDHRADIIKFFAERVKNTAPKTVKDQISAVRGFLLDHGIELSIAFWSRRTGRINARPITKEDIPTGEELRRILSHLDAKGKAVIMFLASTGCRSGETLQLKFSDMDLKEDPPRVHLKGEYTKNKQPRTVFFTSEAKEILEEWLKVRGEWLRYITTRFWKSANVDKEVVFPFSWWSLRNLWVEALKKAGLFEQDKKTNWTTRRLHTLRKRFRTQLAMAIPVDVVEAIMGHSGYETLSYRRYTEEELAQLYKEGEHMLFLSTDPVKVRDIQRELGSRDKEINGIKLELAELRAQLAKRLLDENEPPQE